MVHSMLFDDSVAYLLNLDLSRFVLKSSKPIMEGGYGWNVETAHLAESRYKKWLYLVIKYGSGSVEIDALQDLFWHLHILDTKHYRVDCQKMFGYYLHHNPFPSTSVQRCKITLDMWCKNFSQDNL